MIRTLLPLSLLLLVGCATVGDFDLAGYESGKSIPIVVPQLGDGITDDTAYLQGLINSGNATIPSGTYRITSGLIYSTAGLGNADGLKLRGSGRYRTIIDNQSGGPAITVTSGAGLEFQYGASISDLEIISTQGGGHSVGILMQGVFQSEIKNVRISGQTSHGVYFSSSVGDRTDCSQISVRHCDLSGNGGWGLSVYGGPDAVNSNIRVEQCRVIGNELGGISFYSVVQGVISDCAIAYNSGPGVVVGHAGGPYSKLAHIVNNEFDSNSGTQLLMTYVATAAVERNYFICNPGAPSVSTNIHLWAEATNVAIRDNLPRVPAGYTGVTMFQAPGASISGTDWSSWSDSGNTKGLP